MGGSEITIRYKAAPTLSIFHRSTAFVRQLFGPVGSGKSSACVMEIVRMAREMPVGRLSGKRRSRWLVARNTYPELRDTTIKTFKEWVPEQLGTWNKSEHSFVMKFDDVELEVIFRSFETPEDVKKLLSMELTGAWFNETREFPKAVFDLAQTRVGRFPRREDVPQYRSCVIGDTNPPDDDHWLFKMFFEGDPEPGFEAFRQPGGMEPNAENVEHLERCENWPDHEIPCRCYYPKLMRKKSQAWIDSYIHAKFVFVVDGKPVYPEFNEKTHVRAFETPTRPHLISMGQDYGLTPACVWGYEMPDGQIRISHEFVSEHMGATNFGNEVARDCRRLFPQGTRFEGWGDPSGTTDSSTDERTPIDVVNAAFGLGQTVIAAAPTNDFTLRRDAVGTAFRTMTMQGEPSLIIHPRCKKLRKACAGGYHFKRLQVSGDDRYQDVPLKNEFSHVAEALQYLMVGKGWDRRVLDGGQERNHGLPFVVKRSLPGRGDRPSPTQRYTVKRS
jgi:hypothetical protein